MYWRGRLRFNIPIAIYNAIPSARKLAFRDEVLAMKAYAVKINEGMVNEEMTVLAEWESGSEYWTAQLDLAIPWEVWETIPNERKIAFRDEVLAMKDKAVAIGEDDAIVENWHICHHPYGPCEEEQEI